VRVLRTRGGRAVKQKGNQGNSTNKGPVACPREKKEGEKCTCWKRKRRVNLDQHHVNERGIATQSVQLGRRAWDNDKKDDH